MEESFDNKLENPNPNTDSIRVLVRVRPLNENERTNSPETTIDVTSSQSLLLTNSDHKKTFTCSYDAVLGPLATQAQVYDQVKDCTFALFRGVNSTIFAYGQTGSGKVNFFLLFFFLIYFFNRLLFAFFRLIRCMDLHKASCNMLVGQNSWV